jgi:hypothetical protein
MRHDETELDAIGDDTSSINPTAARARPRVSKPLPENRCARERTTSRGTRTSGATIGSIMRPVAPGSLPKALWK